MTLKELFTQARTSFDLTEKAHLDGLDRLVCQLEEMATLEEIKSLARQKDAPLEFRLAA